MEGCLEVMSSLEMNRCDAEPFVLCELSADVRVCPTRSVVPPYSTLDPAVRPIFGLRSRALSPT